MKIFISGPMTSFPLWNYPCFDLTEKLLVALGFEVVNPANIGRMFGPEKVEADPELYKAMEAEIQKAERTCDIIFLLKGWENSVGVRLELKTALDMGIPIVLDNEDGFDRLRKVKEKKEGGQA